MKELVIEMYVNHIQKMHDMMQNNEMYWIMILNSSSL